MPTSQSHRPGVKVIKSPNGHQGGGKSKATSTSITLSNGHSMGDNDTKATQEYVNKQLKRAANLEEQLSELSSKTTDRNMEKDQQLRHHLCEVLSDVLMTSPSESIKNDCFHRLWRGCFYTPISEWRSRLHREKRKHASTFKDTLEGFQSFLVEAIRLYDFLIHDYLTKLVAPPSTQTQEEEAASAATRSHSCQQQDSQDSMGIGSKDGESQESANLVDPSAPKPPFDPTFEGVVPGLYKLYIHMGDLQRYADSYNKAETYYLNASKLGPGLGNPYNQLAVVNFSKDNYGICLYWYARSLLATHEKFVLSSGNIERLFVTNREKLQEFGRDSKPTILTEDLLVMGCKSGKKPNKDDVDKIRGRKNAASKSCLAYFADLHYDFYLLLQKQDQSEEELAALREKMLAVLLSLESIQHFSVFGDGLLCKLVVISAFSLDRALKSEESTAAACQFPAEFLYLLGTTFFKRLEGILNKTLEKANPSKTLSSVRFLLPLEILMEFVDSILLDEHQTKIGDSIGKDFWRGLVAVGNLVQQIADRYKLRMNETTTRTSNEPTYKQIKEYEVLKGYHPFRVMNQDYQSSKKDGFLQASEAVEVLDLAPVSQSQETAGTSTVSGGNMEENKAKLLRFLELCDKFASPDCAATMFFKEDESTYIYKERNNGNDDEDMAEFADQEPQEHALIPMEFDEDDDAGDIVVYNLPENGTEPPLLVPKCFMSQSTKSPPLGSYDKSQSTATEIELKKNAVTSPVTILAPQNTEDEEMPPSETVMAPSIMPPPGFGPPPGLSMQVGQTPVGRPTEESNATFQRSESLLGQIIRGRKGALPSSFLPAAQSPVAFGDFAVGIAKPRIGQAFTIAECPHLFGEMATANPFAQFEASNMTFASSMNQHNVSGLGFDYEAMNGYSNENSLLDSGLLDSLFGEVKTENPWATK